MSASHRFQDEWILRALKTIPKVTDDLINSLRAKQKALIAQELINSKTLDFTLLSQALQDCVHIQAKNLIGFKPDKMAMNLIPEKLCRRLRLIPLKLTEETIEVGMVDPLNMDKQEDIRAVTGRTPVPFYVLPDQAQNCLSELFDADTVMGDLMEKIIEEGEVTILDGNDQEQIDENETPASIIQFINSIFTKAVRMKASDIHIDHDEVNSLVRFRIDGLLRAIITVPRSIATGPLASRIKVIGSIDIADRLRPHDGRAKIAVGGREISLRISTLPTSLGEKVVIRILDPKSAEVPFEELGFNPKVSQTMEDILREEKGVFLVTGPTGSGKTTTLYSLINKLKDVTTNIVTIEDPVEYKLPGITQVQVNERQGLTFAAVMRSVLRQDPDTILVGEIRDNETAQTAIQAALTGHLVFSTLHTNDACSTITRLVDMGVEKYKILPALLGITAQRLVRRLCPECKKLVDPSQAEPDLVEKLKKEGLPTTYYEPNGCDKCDHQGYKGRLSVVEILELTNEMRQAIRDYNEDLAMREKGLELGVLHSMEQDALWQLSEGKTSLDEVLPYVPIKLKSYDQKKEKKVISAPASASDNNVKNILVIDDDPTTRFLLRRTIKELGYQSHEAVDGNKALETIAKESPDLVLLDLKMPNMDGYSVIKNVRQEMGLANLPIIVLTGSTNDESQTEAINLGADDFIIKPVKPSIVSARINAVFRRLK